MSALIDWEIFQFWLEAAKEGCGDWLPTAWQAMGGLSSSMKTVLSISSQTHILGQGKGIWKWKMKNAIFLALIDQIDQI